MPATLHTSIVDHFQGGEDPRIVRAKRHHVLDILVMAFCTLLTGGEGWQALARSTRFEYC